MNPLLKRLARLRLKVRLLDGWQGLCVLAALVLGVSVTVGVLDYLLQLPTLGRAVMLVGTLIGSGAVVYTFLVKPFGQPCDDLQLALRVEEAYPELNDALASTVQFLKQSKEEQARVGGSDAMREQTVQAAIAKADQCDFGRILDRRGAAIFSVVAFFVATAAAVLVGVSPTHAGTAFWRFVEPFGGHTWTSVAVERSKGKDINWEAIDPADPEQDRIAYNQAYRIRVELHGRQPRSAKVEFEAQPRVESEGTKPVWQSVTPQIVTGDKLKDGKFEMPVPLTQPHYQKFRYRVIANDGAFPPRSGTWHEVQVLPKPRLDKLDGLPSPQIELYPPAYTDLPSPKREVPGTRHVRMFEGTKVVLRAKADRPLVDAWLEVHLQKQVKAAEKEEGDGDEPKVAAKVPPQLIKAEFEADRSIFRFAFTPPAHVDYLNLHLRDAHGLDADERIDVAVERDPVPDIKLIQPGLSLTRTPKASVRFKFRASDEYFAVRSVFIEHQKLAQDGVPAKEDPKRIMVYSDEGSRLMLPFMHALRKLSPRELNVDTTWHLKDHSFKDGDQLRILVCADDFYDLDKLRGYGKSQEILLRIVSEGQLVKEAHADVNKIRERVQKLEVEQREALAAIQKLQKLEKVTVKDKEDLHLAMEKQRNIQEEIGKNADQGLRKELKDIQARLRDNELANSNPAQDARKIKGTLDHIANTELPQIDPKLADARNELANAEKNTPKAQKSLEATARLQKDVIAALSELNKKLEPEAAMQKHRDAIRNIMDKQEAAALKLEHLKAEKLDAEKNKDTDLKLLDQRMRAELEKHEKEQTALAEELRKVAQDIRNDKEEALKNGDKDTAKKLQNALDKLEPKEKPAPKDKINPPKQKENDKPLSMQMKDVADQLKNKSEAPNDAIEKQKQIVQKLDQALADLEGRNQDNTRQDIKDRQDARKEINKLAKEQQQLRKEAQALDNEKDKEERLKKKQELIQKHEEFGQKIAKMERAVARLQEQQAADELKKARDDNDQAIKKLQQEENPQQAQKDVQKDLQKAQNALEDSEEELAREALIKIADKLKGLKEREDALVQRSEDFHSRLMQRKLWADGTFDSIDGNIDAQSSVAEETDGLREKIAQAKVFSDIMEKAKKSMDTAVTNMKERREEGKDRQGPDKMAADQLKAETDWHDNTVKFQKHAAERLGRLLEALKEEIAKPRKPREEPKDVDNEGKKPKDPKKKATPPPRDGISFKAELKLLRADQVELEQRVAEFDRKFPDVDKRTEEQLKEGAVLAHEQAELQRLFEELTAQAAQAAEPMEPMDLPQPKAGEKK